MPDHVVRIMTYNVRRCTGLDGRVSAERIGKIIAASKPDAVVLQEVDVHRKRTSFVDQPARLAELTGMTPVFFPRIIDGDERYGIAMLSKHPMELVKADKLREPEKPGGEVTGAIWATIRMGPATFQLIATHFAHIFTDRFLNIRALIGQNWIGDARCRGPIVFCGDMNTTYRSPVYAEVHAILNDAQQVFGGYKKTWPSFFPVARIDHIFVSKGIRVRNIEAPWNFRTVFASDHLPLIADLLI